MQILAYAIFAGAILAAPAAGLLPRIDRGATTAFRQTLFVLAMPAGQPLYEGEAGRPIFARELARWCAAWAVALVLALPFAMAVAITPFWPAAPLFAPMAWFWRKTRRGKRELHYIGGATEGLLAERMGLPGHDGAATAQRLKDADGDLFSETSVMAIQTKLRKRRPIAWALLGVLARPIRKWPERT